MPPKELNPNCVMVSGGFLLRSTHMFAKAAYRTSASLLARTAIAILPPCRLPG